MLHPVLRGQTCILYVYYNINNIIIQVKTQCDLQHPGYILWEKPTAFQYLRRLKQSLGTLSRRQLGRGVVVVSPALPSVCQALWLVGPGGSPGRLLTCLQLLPQGHSAWRKGVGLRPGLWFEGPCRRLYGLSSPCRNQRLFPSKGKMRREGIITRVWVQVPVVSCSLPSPAVPWC